MASSLGRSVADLGRLNMSFCDTLLSAIYLFNALIVFFLEDLSLNQNPHPAQIE